MSRRFWVGFLAACALLFLLNHLKELTNSVLNAGAVYRRLLTVGFKPPYPANTVIVEIRYGREPDEVTLVNVCQQRLFLSRLLEVIGDRTVAPTGLVVDKYFSPDSCRSLKSCAPAASCDGTPALQTAIRKLLEQNVPIVVGRQFTFPQKVLVPSLTFPAATNGRKVIEGALNLDNDKRRVALVWTGLRDVDNKIIDLDTISFKAALTSRPELRTVDKRLASFYGDAHGPFAGFLPLTSFKDYTFSAIEVLCGKGSDRQTDWQNCSTPNRDALNRMHSKLVVIGESYTGVDQHETVVGVMAGIQLQANYIEAILGSDMFRQVPTVVTYIYGFVVFAMIEFASFALRSYRKAAAIAAAIIGTYALCYLLVQLTGFYLDPGLGVVGAGISQLGRAGASKLNPREPT